MLWGVPDVGSVVIHYDALHLKGIVTPIANFQSRHPMFVRSDYYWADIV